MRIVSLPYFEDSNRYLSSIANEMGLIWFHNGPKAAGTEWFSCWPTKTYCYCGTHTIKVTDDAGNVSTRCDDWFNFLKREMGEYEAAGNNAFTGGLAGHLSYDLGNELLKINSTLPKPRHELANVSAFDWSCYINHEKCEAVIYIQERCPAAIVEKIDNLIAHINQVMLTQNDKKPIAVTWQSTMTKPEYLAAFDDIHNYLVEGDVYQINLTRQWTAEHSGVSDWLLYQQLIRQMPAPFSVFHRTQSHSLLSVSPERFIQIHGEDILTQPIKGTRPRGSTKDEDNALLHELINSEKDKAENLMIVDLLRNDIAKNALPGSVKVEQLFEPHSFNNVHHLISSITATRRPTSHPLDVLRDAFPGGSITGAPKKRAMQIINQLEPVNRGNYCGCAFYLGANNRLDSNILIRTVTYQGETITCNGGGGIVFDSEAENEYQESEFKITSILKALQSPE